MSESRTLQGFVAGAVLTGAVAFWLASSQQPAPASAPPPAALPPAAAAPRPALEAALQPGPPSGSPALDPRGVADGLFNQAMMASERNDAAGVRQFAGAALAAYGPVEKLDDDGLYHVALLHVAAGSHSEALSAAGRVLARSPGHLLALGVAQRAAEAAKDASAAAGFARRLVAAYEAEASKPLAEYRDHGRMLPQYRDAASGLLRGAPSPAAP